MLRIAIYIVNAPDLAKLSTLISKFSPERQRALRRATGGTSSCLISTPLERYHFDLSPNEFWDGLAICYLPHSANLPACCDGCGADFTLQHGMDCKKGGLVIQRHSEVRDCLGDISSEVWPAVMKEPILSCIGFWNGSSVKSRKASSGPSWYSCFCEFCHGDNACYNRWLHRPCIASTHFEGDGISWH